MQTVHAAVATTMPMTAASERADHAAHAHRRYDRPGGDAADAAAEHNAEQAAENRAALEGGHRVAGIVGPVDDGARSLPRDRAAAGGRLPHGREPQYNGAVFHRGKRLHLRQRILATVACAVVAASAAAADMGKTLRVAFSSAETGLDPQASYDVYSSDVCRAIFDALYTFDYFARPVRLVPNTADGLPVVTDGGRTYTIKVKRGIYFADDPAFKGKPRELTAEDYVYSIKRIIDPKVRSYWLYLLEKNWSASIRCSPRRARRARSTTTRRSTACRRSTATRCASASTVRITRSSGGLRACNFAAVAREVIDAYKDASNRVMDNPVGTGPYVLKQRVRGQRIVLEANPTFRDVRYPAPAADARAGRHRDRAGTRGQAAPARRPRRHQHRRGVAAAPALRSTPGLSTISTFRRRWRRTSSPVRPFGPSSRNAASSSTARSRRRSRSSSSISTIR